MSVRTLRWILLGLWALIFALVVVATLMMLAAVNVGFAGPARAAQASSDGPPAVADAGRAPKYRPARRRPPAPPLPPRRPSSYVSPWRV